MTAQQPPRASGLGSEPLAAPLIGPSLDLDHLEQHARWCQQRGVLARMTPAMLLAIVARLRAAEVWVVHDAEEVEDAE